MSLAGKTALVTGATGFLGGALAIRLAQEGMRVKALARSPEKGSFLRTYPTIEIITGDITDLQRMQAVTAGCDYVFHCAAALGGTLHAQRPVNEGGTRNVMLAAAQAQVRRVVHVSSIAVYGYKPSGDVTEDTPQAPGHVPYNVSKAQAESVVRDVAAQHGVAYSIIRPGMIYGPHSSMWTMFMFRIGKRKPTLFVGDGSGSTHPIYIDDVVDLAVVLAEHLNANGEAFNCTPDPAPTWREFIGGYSRLAGHQSWLAIPALPLKPLAYLAEAYLRLRGEPQDVTDLIPFLQERKTYKMTKAHDLLGWQPKVDLQDGINRCAPWLREKGLL